MHGSFQSSHAATDTDYTFLRNAANTLQTQNQNVKNQYTAAGISVPFQAGRMLSEKTSIYLAYKLDLSWRHYADNYYDNLLQRADDLLTFGYNASTSKHTFSSGFWYILPDKWLTNLLISYTPMRYAIRDPSRPELNVVRTFGLPEFSLTSTYTLKNKELELSVHREYESFNDRQVYAFRNLADPFNIYTGNRALKLPYNHTYSLTLTNFSGKGLSGKLNFTDQYDAVISEVIINPDLTRDITYKNAPAGVFSLTDEVSYTTNIRLGSERQLKITPSVSPFNLYGGFNYFNATQYAFRRTEHSAGLRTSVAVGKAFEAALDYRFAFSRSSYSIKDLPRFQFYRHSIGFNGRIDFLPKLSWSNDIKYDYFSNGGVSYVIWTSDLSWLCLKDKGRLILRCFDILGQNRAYTQTITDNYNETLNQLVLRQYFMLSFVYNIDIDLKKRREEMRK